MRDLVHVHESFEIAIARVDNRDLVGLIRGGEEIALAAIPAAVVKETGGTDVRDRKVVDVTVIHQQDVPGFFYVDDELGILVRGYNGGDPRLGMVFLRVDGHAPGRDHLDRLERVAVHDDVLRRPVGTGDRVLVLVALVLGGFN